MEYPTYLIMPDSEFMRLIEKYCDTFGEGPPIFDMGDDEAIEKMRKAIESGEQIADTPDKHIPDDGCL